MRRQVARSCILIASWLLGCGCGSDGPDTIVNATIDMRCRGDADCPARYECVSEVEHGPPTTLCESQDPAATCPTGFEIRRAYGQLFCTIPSRTARRLDYASDEISATALAATRRDAISLGSVAAP
jgi:hypothetical protein